MEMSWLQNIICGESEKIKVQNWIKYNGADRLKRIYEIARGESTSVSYYRITECAKYDARVSQWLFKTIRVIEGHMRAMLLNFTGCYDVVVDISSKKKRKDLKTVIPKILSPKDSEGNIGLDWEQLATKLQRTRLKNINMIGFFDVCSFSEIGRLHSLLLNEEMYDGCIFKGRDTKATDLGIFNRLRNQIAHNHIILDYAINTKDGKLTLKDQIKILLSYIEDKEMRARRIKELNGYAEYYRDGELMIIPQHYVIVVEQ